MNVIHQARELNPAARRVSLAIGFFDGVHLGHQQIIRQTIADARQHEDISLVITFDNHPNTVVSPTRVPGLIYTLEQKINTIGSLGADTLLLVHFDRNFSQLRGQDFIQALARDLGRIRSICVGVNFTFGYKRAGNVELLRALGVELGFVVHAVSAVSLDGRAVSSTRIREAIRNGNLDAASQMLGRTYSLSGEVVRGDRLGHKLGFPTANLRTDGLVLPPSGVYAVHVELNGALHRGVLNIGIRPTVQLPNPPLRTEVHLLDYQGDLYGRILSISFVEKLRDEQKFGSLAELQSQISRDIAAARGKF